MDKNFEDTKTHCVCHEQGVKCAYMEILPDDLRLFSEKEALSYEEK